MRENSNHFIRVNVRSMQGYIPGEQPADPNVIKLNTNENPYPPSPKVRATLSNLDIQELRRYPDPTCSALRTAIANLHGCDAEQVFAGNGSDEVLALCLRAFVELDGSVGFFDPSYSLYPVLAQIQDIETRPVPLTDGFLWSIPGNFETSIFFLTQPNAPTGMLYPRTEVENFCDRFNGIVVIDEAYVDFASRNCMDLALTRSNVLVARTLSKSYSLAGIRLGYLIGNAQLIAAIHKIKDSYNVNMLTQRIAQAAIEDIEYMRGSCERITKTRKRIAAELKSADFEVFPSEANFLWIRSKTTDAKELFEHLKTQNIFVRHFTNEKIKQFLRVTIGTDAEMDTFLAAIRNDVR